VIPEDSHKQNSQYGQGRSDAEQKITYRMPVTEPVKVFFSPEKDQPDPAKNPYPTQNIDRQGRNAEFNAVQVFHFSSNNSFRDIRLVTALQASKIKS